MMPPTYLPVHADTIPPALKALRRWLLWRPELRGEKWTKVPYQPSGVGASSTNEQTWSTFDMVMAAYGTGRWGGIGFVFTPPWCGIDFDHCLDGDGNLPDDVRAWIARADSYTERSVSGDGLHILCTADMPSFGRKVGPRECYNHGRFFTVSGHHWPGTHYTANERTTVVRDFLDALGPSAKPATGEHRTIVPTVPTGRYARLGPKTRAHMESTGPNGYPSASEADAAAAAALIGTGHTAEEALALLLDSPRGQDALARKGRHGEDYLRRTVAHATAFVGPVAVHSDGLRVRYVASIDDQGVTTWGR